MKNKITTIIFIMLIFGTSLFSIIKEDTYFSENENRILASMPKVSMKNILNGKFQSKYETYISDQFIFRDNWITIKTFSELCIGKKEINDVYVGSDGHLFEKYTSLDFKDKQINKNIKTLNKFLNKYSKKLGEDNIKMLIVPNKSQVLTDKLPKYAETYDESIFINSLKENISGKILLDMTDILKDKSDEYIYYKSDHHWTSLGAYYAYQKWCDSINIKPFSEDDFEIEKVSSNFLGTTYSKVNINMGYDDIYLYKVKNDMNYNIIYNMGEKVEDELYDMAKLNEKDKYSVFLGGNNALLEISTNNKNGKTLFVIKDSFSHCFLPFAINHFEKVVVLDLRYLNIDVSKIYDMYDVTDILILYNTVQFMQSKDIYKLK